MNRDILRKLLTDDASRRVAPKLAVQSKKIAGKRRLIKQERKSKEQKQVKQRSKAKSKQAPKVTVNTLTSRPPISKVKKMKLASHKATKRHQMVKEEEIEDTDDLKTSQQLKGSQFRYLNELLYTQSSTDAGAMFATDQDAFLAYHRGFESQRSRWPNDPLRAIIRFAKKLPHDAQVADFGCGDARLAAALPGLTVHSFDFVAVNERVTACDMRQTPLDSGSIDLAVFSLSLMGTNCNEFIAEANRVLKKRGIMKIVEISSRIQRVTRFVSQIEKMGFRCTEKAQTHTKDYFSFYTFVKQSSCPKGQLPLIVLDPCLYKKR